ncbi:MAG TPA: nicotinate-nucleotide adenylyltransferase [Pyrinomonadaceae bacterium]|nr:nicotinate-nucleotide adenylyltransferase [Pyrinomonadaceae bacterium]
MALRRVAIYGGTFDPVHNGHIEAARNVAKLFALDKVIFIPACVPPHKRNAGVTSALHRFAMLALATQDDEELRVSTAELDAPEMPYTVETIARLQGELGSNSRLFFMVGADSWSEITTWRNWQRLLTMCDQIVVTRPGYELSTETLFTEQARVADVRGLSEKEISALMNDGGKPRAFFTDAAMVDVSATAIREAARSLDSEKLKEMVPLAVASYIKKYELYKE